MEQGNVAAGSGWRRFNPALPHLVWRSYRWLYLFSLVFFPVLLLMLVLQLQPAPRVVFYGDPFVAVGVYAAAFIGGSSAAVRDRTVAFLLARPVSRQEIYRALLLGALGPWIVLEVIPNMVILVLTESRIVGMGYHFSAIAAVEYIVIILWTLALYLFIAFVVIYGCALKGKTGSLLQVILWLVIIGLVAPATNNFWAWWYTLNHNAILLLPVLLVTGPVLAVLFYRAGWQRFRTLDL